MKRLEMVNLLFADSVAGQPKRTGIKLLICCPCFMHIHSFLECDVRSIHIYTQNCFSMEFLLMDGVGDWVALRLRLALRW